MVDFGDLNSQVGARGGGGGGEGRAGATEWAIEGEGRGKGEGGEGEGWEGGVEASQKARKLKGSKAGSRWESVVVDFGNLNAQVGARGGGGGEEGRAGAAEREKKGQGKVDRRGRERGGKGSYCKQHCSTGRGNLNSQIRARRGGQGSYGKEQPVPSMLTLSPCPHHLLCACSAAGYEASTTGSTTCTACPAGKICNKYLKPIYIYIYREGARAEQRKGGQVQGRSQGQGQGRGAGAGLHALLVSLLEGMGIGRPVILVLVAVCCRSTAAL